MIDINRTIDLIYEAAFLPEFWTNVLDVMAQGAAAHGTALFNASTRANRALASASLADLSEKMLKEGWIHRNSRAERLLKVDHHGFVDEAAHVSEEEFDREPIFREVMRPLGYGFGASTFINAPSGDRIVFAVEKKASTGSVSAEAIAYLDQLRPHLARAAMISSRLEFERINAAVEALQLSGLPSAVLNGDGKVLGANTLLEQLSPQVLIAGADQVRFGHAAANSLLSDALKKGKGHGRQGSCSFALPKIDKQLPAVAHLLPISGNARDVFAHAAAFLIVSPVDRTKVPGAETIQGLFDLTPAEAKVTRLLALGRDVSTVASELTVSTGTVRTQVKAILSKAGMTRQTDLVAALASMRSIPVE